MVSAEDFAPSCSSSEIHTNRDARRAAVALTGHAFKLSAFAASRPRRNSAWSPTNVMVDWPDERTVGVLLYPHFDLLAVTAPMHAFGMLKGVFDCVLLAQSTEPVASTQDVALTASRSLEDAGELDMLVIPGGAGAREFVRNESALAWLTEAAASMELILTISTGSVLLAATGILDGRRATTSSRALGWARETAPRVTWEPKARFVDDDSVISAAGVGAGLDATLHVISRLTADDVGDNIARSMEHVWIKDAREDPFA